MATFQERSKRPLNWSLEHYPYVTVWGDAPARQETRLETYQADIAAAHWYAAKAIEAKRAKQNAEAASYLHMARYRFNDAVKAAARCH